MNDSLIPTDKALKIFEKVPSWVRKVTNGFA